jgi:hypothetical protein
LREREREREKDQDFSEIQMRGFKGCEKKNIVAQQISR